MSVLSSPQSHPSASDKQQRLTLALDNVASHKIEPNGWQQFCRRALFARLENLKHGQLLIRDAQGKYSLGDSTEHRQSALEVLNPSAYQQIIFGGSLGAGDAFVKGHWCSEDLIEVTRLFARNVNNSDLFPSFSMPLSRLGRKVWQVARRNSRSGSKRNIGYHYDLSNEFFALFLDPSMTYSCGIFESSQTTLEAASLAKYELICRKLDLQPGDHVVELGCGWGGFAEYAARNIGCRVTGITISQRQLSYARRRIEQAGLAKLVDIRDCDYRDMIGCYDKLVSIEMIEAVGHEYLPTFFGKCNSLLKPGGRMLIQGILIPEQRYKAYRCSTDFIQKYIFPGGCLPSLGAINQALEKATDMQMIHLEDFANHYAQTLQMWRENFMRAKDNITKLGFDAEFQRAWDYYFCYCIGGFLERKIGVGQMLFAKD